MKKIIYAAPLMFFLIIILFFYRGLSLNPQELPSVKLNQAFPKMALSSLNSKEKFDFTVLKNHVSLVNVWASWCDSCLKEHAFLMGLKKNIAIYGLNFQDVPEEASTFLATYGNPYQLIGADRDGKFAIELGVYGAPETFLIDKMGRIRYRYAGVMTQEVWEKEFIPKIHALEKS